MPRSQIADGAHGSPTAAASTSGGSGGSSVMETPAAAKAGNGEKALLLLQSILTPGIKAFANRGSTAKPSSAAEGGADVAQIADGAHASLTLSEHSGSLIGTRAPPHASPSEVHASEAAVAPSRSAPPVPALTTCPAVRARTPVPSATPTPAPEHGPLARAPVPTATSAPQCTAWSRENRPKTLVVPPTTPRPKQPPASASALAAASAAPAAVAPALVAASSYSCIGAAPNCADSTCNCDVRLGRAKLRRLAKP